MCLLKHEHDLKEWGAARVALRLRALHDEREGVVLMLEGFEHAPTRLLKEGGEGLRFVDLRAQREGVDEVADRARKLGPSPRGRRRADDDVAPASVFVKQKLEGCEQRRVKGRAVRAREAAKFPRQRGVQREVFRRPVKCLHGRARPVRREFQRGRRAGESARPEIPLPLTLLAREQRLLPAHVAGVTARRRR